MPVHSFGIVTASPALITWTVPSDDVEDHGQPAIRREPELRLGHRVLHVRWNLQGSVPAELPHRVYPRS